MVKTKNVRRSRETITYPKPMKRQLVSPLSAGFAVFAGLAVTLSAAESTKVLIYTRNHVTNGKGFVHDNIATSVAAVTNCTL